MTATILALAILAAPAQAPSASVLFIGDSLTANGVAVDRISRRLPWVEWVGHIPSDWGASHCGYSGYSATLYVETGAGATAVPFRESGSFDVSPYLATNGEPDIVVVALGINYVFAAADATYLATYAQQEIDNTDVLITAIRAATGEQTALLVTSPAPSGESVAAWETAYDPPRDSRARWEGYRATIESMYSAHYSGRTAERIYFLALYAQGAYDADYIAGLDPIHHSTLGYERRAQQFAAQICVIAGCP